MRWPHLRKKDPPKQLTLVEELIEMGEDPALLHAAAREYYENRPLLGQYLVDHGVVSSEKVALALARQSKKRGDFDKFAEHLARASQSVGDRLTSAIDRLK